MAEIKWVSTSDRMPKKDTKLLIKANFSRSNGETYYRILEAKLTDKLNDHGSDEWNTTTLWQLRKGFASVNAFALGEISEWTEWFKDWQQNI